MVGDQIALARLLQAEKPLVWSDNIAPLNVNILPMQLIADASDVDGCVDMLVSRCGLSAPYARQIVLLVLGGVDVGMGRGSAQHNKSEVGGAIPGTPSGANNDSTSD